MPPNEVAIIDKEMDTLPKDPAMLVSAVNMLLRDDEFDTLESLCCNFDIEPLALRRTLLLEGYVYSESQRQMRPVGFDGADGVGKDNVHIGLAEGRHRAGDSLVCRRDARRPLRDALVRARGIFADPRHIRRRSAVCY